MTPLSACPGKVGTGFPKRTCANEIACPGKVGTGFPKRTCANEIACPGKVGTGFPKQTCAKPKKQTQRRILDPARQTVSVSAQAGGRAACGSSAGSCR